MNLIILRIPHIMPSADIMTGIAAKSSPSIGFMLAIPNNSPQISAFVIFLAPCDDFDGHCNSYGNNAKDPNQREEEIEHFSALADVTAHDVEYGKSHFFIPRWPDNSARLNFDSSRLCN